MRRGVGVRWLGMVGLDEGYGLCGGVDTLGLCGDWTRELFVRRS